MGRHQARLLRFCIDYPGWHSMSQEDDSAIRAMLSLADRGLLEVCKHGPKQYQFRLPLPAYERE